MPIAGPAITAIADHALSNNRSMSGQLSYLRRETQQARTEFINQLATLERVSGLSSLEPFKNTSFELEGGKLVLKTVSERIDAMWETARQICFLAMGEFRVLEGKRTALTEKYHSESTQRLGELDAATNTMVDQQAQIDMQQDTLVETMYNTLSGLEVAIGMIRAHRHAPHDTLLRKLKWKVGESAAEEARKQEELIEVIYRDYRDVNYKAYSMRQHIFEHTGMEVPRSRGFTMAPPSEKE